MTENRLQPNDRTVEKPQTANSPAPTETSIDQAGNSLFKRAELQLQLLAHKITGEFQTPFGINFGAPQLTADLPLAQFESALFGTTSAIPPQSSDRSASIVQTSRASESTVQDTDAPKLTPTASKSVFAAFDDLDGHGLPDTRHGRVRDLDPHPATTSAFSAFTNVDNSILPHSAHRKGQEVHELTMKKGDANYKADEKHDMLQARQSLEQLAGTHGEDMTEFRKRMDQLQARVPGEIGCEEVANTYKAISRLLEPPENIVPEATCRERSTLARQILQQAAQPNTIRQGDHNTCNVATVENLVYTEYPSKAATMVADIALTGYFTSAPIDGKPATTIASNSHPIDFDAKQGVTYDNQRTYASEIFQVGAVRLWYQQQNDENHTDIEYNQKYVAQNVPAPRPTGESLIDYTSGTPQVVAEGNGPCLPENSYQHIENMITGKHDTGRVMDHAKYVTPDIKEDIYAFADEQSFEKYISEAKANRKLPLILGVFTGNDPFASDDPDSRNPGGGGHVITIRDYIPGPPAKVMIDNQWFRKDNHDTRDKAIDLHELYLSTMKPEDSAREMAKDVERSKKEGAPNSYAEFESLRLQWISHQMNNNDFQQKLSRQLDTFEKERMSHSITPAMEEKTVKKILNIMAELPLKDTVGLINKLHQVKILNDKEFKQCMIDYLINFRQRQRTANFLDRLFMGAEEHRLGDVLSGLPPADRQFMEMVGSPVH